MSSISYNDSYLNSYVFSSNYKSLHTNVSSLSDAQIIILPECHYSENDQIRNAWIINKLYQEGDVVLVESPNDETKTFHQINKVYRTIDIRGWDCLESDEALHRSKKPFYDLSNRLANLDGFENEHRQILLEAIETGPCKTDALFKKYFIKQLDDFNQLAPNLKKSLLFRRIQVWHEVNGEVGKVLANTFSKRQESLIKKCQQFSKTNNRIFIIAGASHVLSETYDRPFVREGVELLHNHLKEKKFVIFDYSRTPTKLLKADLKLWFMLSSIEKTIIKICDRASKIFVFFLIFLTLPMRLPYYLLSRNR